jgi:NTP pyrophosphatase (non-canonical NTP hydrolase)
MRLWLSQADHSPDKTLAFPLLGLFGEAGSLLSVVKKKQRDRAAYLGYAPHVIEELGDVLWYFTVVAARSGVKLADIGNNLQGALSNWRTGGSSQLRFGQLQTQPRNARDKPTPLSRRRCSVSQVNSEPFFPTINRDGSPITVML